MSVTGTRRIANSGPDVIVEHLNDAACMRLLGTVRVGRVALTQHALPVVVAVNCLVDADGIVIRSSAGSLLAASHDDVVVAFEADVIDEETCHGWSVLVTGTMREIPATTALLGLSYAVPLPCEGGELPHFVRITPGLVSGRSWAVLKDVTVLPNGPLPDTGV